MAWKDSFQKCERTRSDCNMNPEIRLGSNRDSKSGNRTATGSQPRPWWNNGKYPLNATSVKCMYYAGRCWIVTIGHEVKRFFAHFTNEETKASTPEATGGSENSTARLVISKGPRVDDRSHQRRRNLEEHSPSLALKYTHPRRGM